MSRAPFPLPVAHAVTRLPGAHVASMPICAEPDPTLLTKAERALFAALATERRRAEWWSGRMVARATLTALGAGSASILADARGAPRLEGGNTEGVSLSLTHGSKLTAAIAAREGARFPCVGIDLVDAEDLERILRLEARVLTAREKALVEREPRAAMLAWGAREAIAKATSTGMFVFALARTEIVAIDWQERGLESNLAGIAVAFEALDDGGFLVLAGASHEAARAAQEVAGLKPAAPDR